LNNFAAIIILRLMDFNNLPQLPYFWLFIIYSSVIIIQLFYYWGIFIRLAFHNYRPAIIEQWPEVSVVICARNEYENLKKNLPYILNQDYPVFEVVVVNHTSDDDSLYVLRNFQKEYPNLSIVNIEKDLNFFSGKKFPLSIGIKSAKHEIILLTDADCRPASAQWIKTMVSAYTHETSVVLGYSGFYETKGLGNIIQRFNAFHTALQYLSLAMAGMPYMGVGRNLSYKKSLFYQVNGFISHYSLESGDDDLFINQVATKSNTRCSLDSASFTFSSAKKNFREWIRQKRRHLTTGLHYKPWHKFVLGLYSLSQFLVFFFFIILLLLGFPWPLVVSMFILRLISQLVIYGNAMKKLQTGKLLLISPILEFIEMIVLHYVVLTNRFVKRKQWK